MANDLLEDGELVTKVIIIVGTNDIINSNNDPDNVHISVSEALRSVKETFPGVPIGVCTIIPRKG